MSSNKWKSNLVSSGLPLEFDIAKLLAAEDYGVSANYAYTRVDSNTSKEFSVDLSANQVLRRTGDPPTALASVQLLIECKQRQPDIKWLFFPRVPMIGGAPYRSWDIVRVIDEFFSRPVDWSAIRPFSMSLPVAFKGAEVNLDKGDVYDKEIRHGIAQLQYALPSLVNQLLRSLAIYPSSRWVPHLFVPLLVTTADLYLVKDDAELEDFSACESLDDIAVRVPYLCYSATVGPDFESHAERLGAGLGRVWKEDDLASLDKRVAVTRRDSKQPSAIVRAVETGYGDPITGYPIRDYYEDFVVCTRADLPVFLSNFQRAVTATGFKDINGAE